MAEQKTAYERLKEYEAKGCHMLIPSMISVEDITPGFALVIDPVLLKAHPRDRDVYPHESSQYDNTAGDWKADAKTGNELVRITKQGLDRLARAAKIDWLPAQIVRDPNNQGRMMASVEGMIRTSTGELYRVQDIAGMDLEIEREKIIANYSYNGKQKDNTQWKIDRDFLQKKANQEKLCISGAKNRVIRQILSLRNTYTVKEMEKEFVAVRVVLSFDMKDEYTRKRLTDMHIAQLAVGYGIYPPPQQQQQIEMSGEVPDAALNADDVIDGETVPAGNGKPYHLDPKAPLPADDESPFASPPESLRADFMACDKDGQCKTLRVIAGEAGRDIDGELKATKKTLEGCTAVYRLKLYDYLTGWGKEKAA